MTTTATPMSPAASASPSTFTGSGTVVTATVSLRNRPLYTGKKKITGLTTITPSIVVNRPPTGAMPFHIQVSAEGTTHDGARPENAYIDLHYEWDFGDPSGTETATDYWNGKTVNANNCQQGPEAVYLYRTPGTYTITLTVKGKDSNGDLVTASTTTMKTTASYYIYAGGGTGGTYTLTFNDGAGGGDEVTAAIPYSATARDIAIALRLLPSLDDANCADTYMRAIEMEGNLRGSPHTLTMQSSITGTVSTPFVRAEQPSVTATSVTVTDISGYTAQYFDATYDGSNGTSNGTEERPYTSWTNLSSWARGGSSRRIRLKSGTTMSMTASITFETAVNKNLRWEAYGTGARPIIISTGQRFIYNNRQGTSSNFNVVMEDHVYDGIDFRSNGGNADLFNLGSGSADTGYSHHLTQHIAWANCKWGTTLISPQTAEFLGGQSNPSSAGAAISSGSKVVSVHHWRSEYNGGGAYSLALLQLRHGKWFSAFGCSLLGGTSLNTDSVFDHHIYHKGHGHSCFRYNFFGDAQKNLCIKHSSNLDAREVLYSTVDGNSLTGTQNPIGIGNVDGVWVYGDDSGHWNQVVVQFNRIRSTDDIYGVLMSCVKSVAIRDNQFWKCEQQAIVASAIAGMPFGQDLHIYRNLIRDGRLRFNNDQIWYLHDNVMDTRLDRNDGPGVCIELAGDTDVLSSWDVDNNIWYNPGNGSDVFTIGTGSNGNLSFTEWQTLYGHDLNGQNTDPLFADPTNGLFTADPSVIVDWPAGFTNHEYSLDDGETWTAYTDGATLVIGDDLDAYTEVLFRATSPADKGPFIINVTTNGSSLNVTEETTSVTVTGLSFKLVKFVKAGSTVYTLAYEA